MSLELVGEEAGNLAAAAFNSKLFVDTLLVVGGVALLIGGLRYAYRKAFE